MMSSMNSFLLVAVPLFVLAGNLMAGGGISDRIFRGAEVIFGRFRGGLGQVNIASSAIFGGISGSSVADIVSLGKIEIKAMTDHKYPRPYAAAMTMVTATLSSLIPPSILMIIAASEIFSFLLTIGQIPQALAAWIADFRLSPLALLLLINVLLLLAGIFIEPLPGVMIFVPILAPLALAAGIHPLHFAMVVIVNLTLGMITPPVGALLFVTSIVSGVPMGRMTRELLPMFGALLVVLILLTLFPGVSTWLPGVFGYSK